MFTLIAENKYGQQLELTHNDAYVITEIDGLDPPDATINTSKNANADGSVYNSSYINDRQIIITMAINYPAEENRINLYQYFKTKMPITLYYQNDSRDVYIQGYVQNMQIGFFDKKQIAQITILCPKPLFNDVNDDTSKLSQIADLFEFPFSIESGPGKNLLPYPYYHGTRTYNGITYTDNGDGTITANGTATAYSDDHLQSRANGDFMLPDGTYVINGCPEGGGTSTYRVMVGITVNGSWQTIAADSGSGATFTYDSSMGNLGVVIAISNGATVNNVTFKPMISVAGGEYEPYEYNPGIEFSSIGDADITIINDGDVESGFTMTFHALDDVSNPVIYNTDTNEYFGLNVSMSAGDEVIVCTKPKEKSVTYTAADGTTSNAIGNVQEGSTWLQLIPGVNNLTMTNTGNPGDLYVTFTYTSQYEGV